MNYMPVFSNVASILDRLRSVLNESTIILAGICVDRTKAKQHCMAGWIPNLFIKINFS